jgi:transcriptional regulator with PAS, ATPase and Fis domain
MHAFELSIQDPGGHVRRFTLKRSLWLGRDPEAPAPLKDAMLPARAGEIRIEPNDSIWMKAAEGAPAFRLGDLETREARLIEGMGVRWGESELRLVGVHEESAPTPSVPAGAKAWLTHAASGRRLLWDARKAARTPMSIYIEGETGTGKEVLAHLIHAWSSRAAGPFVPLNCAALNLSIVESELFGHVKGAYTGAHHQRPGALMQAHNGTLFLDEVGDLPADIQVKLLRFLENGEIRPVGSDQLSRASVRIVCATHKSLKRLVESGRFRQDLYYRLASVTLSIPALRDRPEDVALLSRQFADEFGKILSPGALGRIRLHGWPGNVRQLRHALERACALSGDLTELITEEHLEFLTEDSMGDATEGISSLNIQEMERHLLLKALKTAKGNRTQAAKLLGVARSTLFEMIKRHRVRARPGDPVIESTNPLIAARTC